MSHYGLLLVGIAMTLFRMNTAAILPPYFAAKSKQSWLLAQIGRTILDLRRAPLPWCATTTGECSAIGRQRITRTTLLHRSTVHTAGPAAYPWAATAATPAAPSPSNDRLSFPSLYRALRYKAYVCPPNERCHIGNLTPEHCL